MDKEKKKSQDLVYQISDKPKNIKDWILYSGQWLVTMIYAVVWGYAIVGKGMDFQSDELVIYISAIVLTIGISTLIQSWLGHKMAMVSGPNIIPSLAIIAAVSTGGKEYAIQAFFAQTIVGLAIILLTSIGLLKMIKKIWSPLILGSMVLMVGLSISKQGVELLTSNGFDWQFLTGIILALVGIVSALKGKGIWGTLTPMIIIVVGYPIFMFFGDFAWDLVRKPSLFVVPKLFPYGIAWPAWDLLLIMFVVSIMSSLNFYGNLEGYSAVVNEKVEDRSSKRSFFYFGTIENCIPGILGVPATVAYGENIGIVSLTKVASRYFIIVASIIFIGLAFIGPVSGFMAAMPDHIAGALLLGIASSVIGIGITMMTKDQKFEKREQSIVGFSVFLSLGLFLLSPETWKDVPILITTILSNPIISVILFILIFEKAILRKRNTSDSLK